jgi:hypothetical protein
MELTDWYPCWIDPVREGLYEVQRIAYAPEGFPPTTTYAPELVEWKAGKWDTKGKTAVWTHSDKWRGVANVA